MATEKRDKILNIALKLFVEQGFHGTSTSQIAKESEVATGTLFHHFKNKEELIGELYLSAKFALANYLEVELSLSDGPREKMRSLWFAFVKWAIEHENEYRFFRHCEATPYISENIRQEGEARFGFIFELFADVAAKRKDENMPQTLLLDLYVGMLYGFIHHLMKNPEVRRDHMLWENAFDSCWEAMS